MLPIPMGIVSLVNNTALLLTLGVLYDLRGYSRPRGSPLLGQAATGLILGGMCIVVMLIPWQFGQGVMFDTRSVLLSLSGLFFGTFPTLIAALVAAGFRLALGGAGGWTGVLVICVSGAIGVIWRHVRARRVDRIRRTEFYLFGWVVHVAMLLCMFTLPKPLPSQVLATITVPVLAIYPVATMLMGWLLRNRERRMRLEAEHMAALDALRISETRLRELYDHMSSGVAIYEAQGDGDNFIIRDLNEAALRITKVKREEAIGRLVTDVFPGVRDFGLFDVFQRVWRSGQPDRLRTSYYSNGVLNFWAENRVFKLPSGELVAIFDDVTERENALALLRESESMLRAVFHSSADLITITDMETGAYVEVNEGFLRATGYTRDEVIGKTGEALGLWAQPYQRSQIVQRLSRGQEVRNEEVEFRKKDRTPFIGLLTSEIIRVSGRPNLLCIVRDITERKRMEEALARRNRDLQILNELSRGLAQTLDLQRIYVTARDYVTQLVDAPVFGISLYDAASRTLRATFMSSGGDIVDSAQFPPLTMPLDAPKPLRGRARAILTAEPEVIGSLPDVLAQTGATPQVIGPPGDQREPLSAAYIPMVVEGQVVGLMEVQSYRANAYDKDATEVLRSVAGQIGLAIQNARLFRQVQSYAAELECSLAELRQAQEALRARDAILEATNFSAQVLLQARRWEVEIQNALSRLGKAANASRAYIFENHPGPNGEVSTSQRYEWCSEGITPQIDNPDLQDFPMKASGFSRWVELLSTGESVFGAVREFPAEERLVLEAQDILSLAVVPIFVSGQWWGFMGFDDCRSERRWNPLEMEALQTAASLLGAAFERQQAEEALRASEARFRGLVESMDDIVFTLDREGRHTGVFGRWLEKHSTPPEMYLGKTAREVLGPEAARVHEEANARALAGENVVYEWHADRPDGRFHIQTSLSPLVGADGQIIGIVGVGRDITPLKRAEEALRESEERYRLLVDLSPDGICVHRYGEVLFANSAAAAMFGADSPQSLIGRQALDLVAPEYRDLVRERMRQGQEEQVPAPLLEEKLLRVDGTEFWAEVCAVPIEWGGEPAVQVLIRDVTERKRLEERLLQAHKMEVVGRLAGGVAHDFNNILTAITGYATFVLESLPPGDLMRSDVEEILRSAERAANLTQQLLAFSRRQIIKQRVINLNDLILNLDKMLRRLIGEDIELVILPVEGLWQVKADPGQIEQALMNLAVNARDAMPHGGKLILETANVTVDEEHVRRHPGAVPGDYVMLAITDTGVGMPDEVKAHLFEPFFTTKEPGEGTGLGLATVYGIVKQHGGNIYAYSEPGKGATFKIYLPAVEAAAERLPRTDEQGLIPRGTETVLVAEDESMVRAIMVRALAEQGYRVLEAADGDTALRLAREYTGEIHLLLTDVVMPQMDGKELSDRIAALRPGIKTLFVSGYTENAVVHRGVQEHGIAFLKKPFTAAAICRKVRQVLDMDQGGSWSPEA